MLPPFLTPAAPAETAFPARRCAGRVLLFLACWLLNGVLAQAQPVSLATLRSGHPRLAFTPDNQAAVRALKSTDPRASSGYSGLKAEALKIIAGTDHPADKFGGPVVFPYTNGTRVNNDRHNPYARYLLKRMQTLAGLYQLDGDARWFNQAKADLLAIANFPYWNRNPNQDSNHHGKDINGRPILDLAGNPISGDWQFLEASSLMIAASYGYDWLYNDPNFSAADKKKVRDAIFLKGLQEASDVLALSSGRYNFWAKVQGNWGLICNAGIGVGALAVAGETPPAGTAAAVVPALLAQVRDNYKQVLKLYGTDGGHPEGLTYWAYGLEYQIYFYDALDTALRNDLGLLNAAAPTDPGYGFSLTGLFPWHMNGPLGKNFNYADQGDGPQGATRETLWMARKLNKPSYAQRALAKPSTSLSSVLHMVWYKPSLLTPAAALPPKDGKYNSADNNGPGVATLRSSWKTKGSNGFFTGLLAGPNEVGHAHLDNGMFVLDGLGQRWALDLGLDNYNLPGYFSEGGQGSQRWKYYRCGTEGQNTLAISANTQKASAFANQKYNSRDKITAFQSSAAKAFVVTDLTDSYAPIAGDARSVSKVQRGVMLLDSTQVLIQDEVTAGAPVEVLWMMHTQAALALADGTTALPTGSANPKTARTLVLTQGGKKLKVEILAPAGAYFDAVAVPVTPGGYANPAGVRNLLVRLGGAGKTPAGASFTTIRVRFVPASSSAVAPAAVPLANWGQATVALAAPTGLTAAAAAAAAATQVRLAWANPNTATSASAVLVERSATSATAGFAPLAVSPALGGTAVAYVDDEAAAATTYHYRVRARNAAGAYSAYSNVATVTTPAKLAQTLTFTALPAVPYAAGATVAVQVSNSAGAAGGALTYALGAGSPATLVGNVLKLTGPGTVVVTATAAATAVYAAGTATASFAVTAPAGPAAPTNLAAAAGPTRVVLRWQNANTVASATSVLVERSTTSAAAGFTQLFARPDTALVAVDATVAPGTTYYYRVRANNTAAAPAQQSAYSNVAAVTTPALTLVPLADAYVHQDAPTTPHGSEPALKAKLDNTAYHNTRRIYLKFDLGALPAAATSVTLRLHGALESTRTAALTAGVYPVASTSWTEAGLTWANQPAAGSGAEASASVSGTAARYYEWDLTAYANRERAAGRTLISVAVQCPAVSVDNLIFNSKEAAANRPELVVNGTAPALRLETGPATAPAPPAASALVAYPNPSPDGRPTLTWTVAQAQRVTVYVLTAQGTLAGLYTLAVPAGDFHFLLPAALPAGTYFVKATLDGRPCTFTLKVE